ncbi:MAG TPA: hypothetical protein VKY92_11435 [Verrucomicrobiae bacterium]|nr:hypothetical protein [Verrucomicrobiae bacterium]
MRKHVRSQQSRPADSVTSCKRARTQAPDNSTKVYLRDPDFVPSQEAQNLPGWECAELRERILAIPPHEREILRKMGFKIERGMAQYFWAKSLKPLRQLVPDWRQLFEQFLYRPADWVQTGRISAQLLVQGGKAQAFFKHLGCVQDATGEKVPGFRPTAELALWRALGALVRKATL